MDIEIYPTSPEKVGVYSKFGSKSTQVCDLHLNLSGFTFVAAVWARETRDKDTGEVSVTVEPGLPQGVKIDDDDLREEYREIAKATAEAMIGYTSLEDKALERLERGLVTSSKGRTKFTADELKARADARVANRHRNDPKPLVGVPVNDGTVINSDSDELTEG